MTQVDKSEKITMNMHSTEQGALQVSNIPRNPAIL